VSGVRVSGEVVMPARAGVDAVAGAASRAMQRTASSKEQFSHPQRGGGGALRVMNATLCRGQSSSSSRRRHVCAWSVDVDDSVHLQTRLKSRMAGNECKDLYLYVTASIHLGSL